MERYTNGWCKVYLAEFKDKETKNIFYKIGYTSYKDAEDRFNYEPEQYSKWDIRILATILCSSKEMALLVEKTLLLYNPKNLWIDEKIVGVTEIFEADKEKYLDLLKKFHILGKYAKSLYNFTGGKNAKTDLS